jgi:hypothetical protein
MAGGWMPPGAAAIGLTRLRGFVWEPYVPQAAALTAGW